MSKRLLTSLLLLLLALALAPQLSVAQSPSEGGAAATADDVAFAPLQQRFRNLYQSLQSLGGLRAEQRPLLETLRDDVAAFNGTHPDYARGIAMEYQISRWLGDEERADALLLRLMSLRPDDVDLRVFHAERLRTQNRYAEALALLSGYEEQVRDNVKGSLLLSNLLYAENRFAESVAALESMEPEAFTGATATRSRIDRELATRREYAEFWQAEQEIRSTEAAADDLPRAEIVLERGRIEVELFENEAPNTVANFVKLARSGFYDGTTFHRVINNFMAQGGDPNTKEDATGLAGQGNPGYYIADEHQQENARKHFAGSLAMAKTTAPNTAGSQFYLTHEPLPNLNGLHTVFGRVISGLDIVREIELNDRIQSITILRARDHDYEPETIPLPGQATPTPASEDEEAGAADDHDHDHEEDATGGDTGGDASGGGTP